MDLTHSFSLVGALMALLVASCSGEEPATASSTTDTIRPTTTAGTTPEEVDDSALVDILATELMGGVIDPLPMDAETAHCIAEGIIDEMGSGEGQSLEDYLASRDDAVEDETVDLVLASYFECSDAAVVGDALATDLIETIGLPAEDSIKTCLSERLDSADEVRGIMGLDGGATGPVSVLEGCVGLGDVMSVQIAGLTGEQHDCLNREGEEVLAGMLAAEDDGMSLTALRSILEGCGLDPGTGSVPE